MESLNSDSVLVHPSRRSSAPELAGAIFQGGAAVALGADCRVAVAAVAVLVFLAGAGKDRRWMGQIAIRAQRVARLA